MEKWKVGVITFQKEHGNAPEERSSGLCVREEETQNQGGEMGENTCPKRVTLWSKTRDANKVEGRSNGGLGCHPGVSSKYSPAVTLEQGSLGPRGRGAAQLAGRAGSWARGTPGLGPGVSQLWLRGALLSFLSPRVMSSLRPSRGGGSEASGTGSGVL